MIVARPATSPSLAHIRYIRATLCNDLKFHNRSMTQYYGEHTQQKYFHSPT